MERPEQKGVIRMRPVKFHTQEPLCFTKEINTEFLGESCFNISFHLVIKTKVQKVIYINGKINRQFAW
jgi:hypothetical protein